MHESRELKQMTVAEFAREAEAASRTLVGYIAFGADPTAILFTPTPAICPFMPIPKDTIESLRLGSTHPCFSPGQPAATMWDAEIVVNEQIPTGSSKHWVNLAVSLAGLAASSEKSCSCGSQAVPRPSAARRSRPFTNYVATCTFYCSDGSSLTTSRSGTSPAEARTNAQNNAVLQGCDITGFGPCNITP